MSLALEKFQVHPAQFVFSVKLLHDFFLQHVSFYFKSILSLRRFRLTGILSILAVAQLLSRKNSKSRHHDQNHENQYIMYKPSQKCHSQVLPFPNSSHPV